MTPAFNHYQWLHFPTKGQLSFLKESDVFDFSTKICIVFLHAFADEYDGWLCFALSIFTHTCCVHSIIPAKKNPTQIFSTKIFAFMVIMMFASVFFS